MGIEPTPETWEAFVCIGITPLPTIQILPADVQPNSIAGTIG